MRIGFVGASLFAFVFLGCMQDRLPSAFQGLGNRAAAAEQQTAPASPDCQNYAPLPGQGREYDVFKNLAAATRGCATPSPVVYEKNDGGGRPVPSQQEELDRAACRSEGERAATATNGLQPGEYDIFKSNGALHGGDVEKIEQSCMMQKGYKSVTK
jgi:hypothetical protein